MCNKSVIDYLKFNSEAYGEKDAIVCGGAHITFEDLYKCVAATAGKIRHLYAEDDRYFLVRNNRSIETIVLMLSLVAAGKCYRVADDDNEDLSKYILLHKSFVTTEYQGECFCDINLPMYEVYTSGTTGEPKRIVKTQKQLLDFIIDFSHKFNLSNEDVFLNQLEFTFDASTKDIYCMVVLGATLHIGDRQVLNFPVEFSKYVKNNGVTIFVTTPFFIKNMAKLKGLAGDDLSSLKYVMFVGESMKAEYLNYWIEALDGVMFVNLYGTSELAGNSLYHMVENKVVTEYVPLDKTFLDYEYDVVDGELVIKSRSQNLLYKTGDLATVVDAKVFINGRLDNLRKLRGYRISLEAIEKEIEKLECINEALCEQQDDSIYVVFTSDIQWDIRLLQKELKDKLPRFVQPVKIRQVENIPTNKNGKVDRKGLLQ